MSPFYRRRRLERLVRASVQLEELEERFLLAADLGQDSMPLQWRPSLKIESVSIATNSPLSNSPTWMAETVGSADGSADQHDHTWAPHHNHTHDHGGDPNHSPACQCEQCLGVDLKQDHNHTHDDFHDHIHHHHHHDHGVDPNHSPGCQCEQCLGVDLQQTNSQHHGHHHDHASPSAEGYDRLGNWIFVEAREPDSDNSDLFDSPVSAAPSEAPLADTFKLHSLPDASHTIYLDFDGHTTTGTTWNAASGQSSIVSPAYDPSNDGSNFNDNELARIQRIWQRVAEDFSPFQVNVTTEDPGAAALSRSNNSDTDWGTRVVITEDWDNCSCGGFAYLNSFMDSTDEPVFVFNTGEIGVSAAATHEVGHALGLSHDGLTTGAAYYGGHASGNAETGWGPIMGSGYSQNMTTWDAGDYYNANNSENDWEIITTQNGFGYRTDDHGNNSGSATTLDNYGTNTDDTSLIDVGGFGVIELDTDTDWFTFEAAGGQINLTINPYVTETYVNTGAGYTRYVEPTAVPPTAEQFSNLDVLATLYDSNLNVVATSNPTDSLIASFEDLAVTPDTYYLSIDGIGVGDWTASNPVGYDQSISRGMFAISGRIPFSDSGLIALADSAITEVDQAVSINVLANDYDPDGGSFGITSLGAPANGSITESSGIITYTPNAGFAGTDSFPYTITDDQGEQDSTMVTITVNPPLPPILYVDDDQGKTFERFYEDALSANDLEYDIWTVSTAGEPVATDLADYSAVIWNTGVDYTAASAGLTTGEQSTVATYLDGGGRMFIVGQDILYKPVEPDFRTDYLKVAQFTNDVQGLSTFVGVPGNEIGDGLSLPVQLPSDFGSDWGDTLAPTADAEGVFYRNTVNSNSQPYNTVAYSGDDFRIVFMAAGFEGISTSAANPNNQNAVLGRIMDYLMSDPNQSPVATDNNYSVDEDSVLNSGNVLTDGVADSDPDGDPLSVSTTPVSGASNGSVTLQTNGSFTYTPAANFNGEDSFVYQISDGKGGSDTATVTITVNSINDAPTANDDSATTNQDVSIAGSPLANDSDIDGDTLSIDSFTQATNGTVTNNGGGTLLYTPDSGYIGSDSFTYTISDGNGGTDTATVSLSVLKVNQPPIANDDSATTDEDAAVNISPLANDTDSNGDTLTIVSFTQASNGTVSDNGGGSLTYTPNSNYNGDDSFTYSVSDGDGGSDTATVTITVNSINDAPTANDDAATTDQDVSVTVSPLVNDSDIDGDTLSIDSFTQAANGTVTNNGNGTLLYTPDSGYIGSDSFTYTVSDGNGGTDTASVSLSVTEVNQPPIANDDSVTTDEDNAVNISPLANDTDGNGDTLTIVSFTQASNGTVSDNGDGSLTYTPNSNYNGNDSFTYTISDGKGDSDTATITITVNSINDAPTANDDSATTDQDVSVVVSPLTNDSDSDGDTLSIDSFTQAANGTVTNNGGGTLLYTPDSGYVGSDSFTYTISDGNGGTDTATVSLSVLKVNQPPIANDDSATTDEDTAVNISPLANDTDSNGDTLTIVSFTQASNGTVSDNGDGSLTYTPNSNYNGDDSFTYSVSDGDGGSDTATVTITVNSINDAPTANDDSATTDQDVSVVVSPLTNDSDSDGDTLSIDSFTQAANGTVTNNGGGTLLYTPDSGYVGSDSFTYTISDGNGGTDTATVSLSVLKVNQPPIANDDSATTDEDTAVNISPLANDTDSNGDTLTIVSYTQASSGTVSGNGNGSLTYTPNSNYNGNDSFTYSVSDGDGGSDTATVTITVNSINDAPTANNDSATTDQDVSVTVSPLANDSDIDGDTLSIDSFTQAANGTVTNNGNGTLLYTPDSGYVGSDSFTYTISDGNGGTDTASVSVTVAPLVGLGPKIATSILTNVGTADWITVPLSQNYNSPIIVATPVHVPGRAPVVTRIGNISSNSFDIRVQRVDGVTDELTGIQVQYVVADEGVYTEAEHGIKMEAVRFSSTITDHKGNWIGESSFYSNSYTSPVVLGQVMSYNQSEFSVFWTSGSSRTRPPSATDFKVGKHVGEDPNTTRIDETLGYLVIEAGSGTVDGLEYSAAIGADIVRGTQHPVTQYSISGLSTISSIILSQVAMDGGDGGWAVLSGTNPINGTTIDLAIEEDLLKDTERWHTSEQVAYLAFNASNANPTANDDTATTLEDTSITISVLNNDSDANSDPLSINSFTQGTSGTVTDNGDGSLTYTPNGNYNGSDAFNYTVSDGNGGTDTATVNVTITPVNDDPTADDDTATVNEDGTIIITVFANDNDIDGDSVSIDSFEQGSNGTVTDNGNGTLTYVPDSNYNGSDAFNYTVSDGNGGTDTATVNITITPVNDDPTANDDTATANEDGTVIITVLANDNDIDGDTVSIDSFEQGSNGTVTNNGDGTLTYAPNSNYSGSDAFNYTVSDGNGGTDTATVNVTITPENDPPVAANDSASTDQDTPVVVSPLTNDSDVDGDTLSISSFTQATNGTVTDNGGGTLTYTPNSGYVGTDSFTYTVSDGNGETDTATVNLAVLEVNQPPVANDDSATTNEDIAVNISSLANDTDSNGDTLSIASFTQGSNGTVTNNGDGTLTYAPNANFNGSDSFSYTISDGRGGSDAATVDVTITPVNDDPAANDDTATVNEDDTVIITVLNNDNDIDGDSVSIDSFGQGSNGTVTDNGDGTLTYTPTSNYNGSDVFNYTVSDGNGGTDTGTVNVTITPENDPPVAADDSASTDQDTPVVVSPLVNDNDVDGDTLSISSFTQATNGTVTDNGGDTLLYTPNGGYVGTDSFTYTVSDNNGATDTATVNVTVDPVVASGPKLESGIVSNVGTDDWTTVTLTTSYTSMVVVATLVLPNGTAPLVTRIDNVAANSFDLRVQRADGLTGTISGIDVHYIAVEEGIYTQADDGITMEAVKFTSTVTDGRSSWVGGESRNYNNSYSSPVVLGQVMSFNDSNFSVFWALGTNRGSVPDSSDLSVGKHVGEDLNFSRANETIGYVVIESGTGTINGFEYSAAVGSDTIRGTDNGSYTYEINGLSSPNTVALSSAGMDGRDGSWPVLLAPTPLSGATINLAVDEDQLRDGERRHTTEQVAYFAVSTPVSTVATSLDANLLSEPSLISDVTRRVDRVLGILDAAASDTEVESGLARHWDLQLADIFSSISSLFDDDQQSTNSDASEAGFSEAAETALSEIRSWLLGDGPLPSNVDDIFADYI